FEASCFDGDYITGDVKPEYLDAIESARLEPASQADRDQSGEGAERSQMNLQLSVD
ncbi:amidophosphoribosyltransferase, partial [Burkholderia pseudomallei]